MKLKESILGAQEVIAKTITQREVEIKKIRKPYDEKINENERYLSQTLEKLTDVIMDMSEKEAPKRPWGGIYSPYEISWNKEGVSISWDVNDRLYYHYITFEEIEEYLEKEKGVDML
jgi:hypothetical protein